ncbi:unnamed protein product [Paramecium primaurelia]|uniref:VWFA domain-containing protein n=1 Tax=Paramecium primaurelia TaxID=5886 RepID=A0A8S1MI21_PARPR|nr:unnamed protein product [Paramecium primaurelia]
MSNIIILSDYEQTKKLSYLIKDKQENYFSNATCFVKILDNFLDKLKEEDKRIAIVKLNQIFPDLKLQNNMITTPKSRSMSMVFDITFYQELDNIKKTYDWVKLQQIFQQNQFYMDGKYPNNFIKLIPFIEKLKNKSFLLIEIAEYFKDCQFQLNQSIFKNLLFYFYLPLDLNLTQAETQEIEKLIGEIINQSWLQFEYHQYQLIQNNDSQSQLKLLQVVPKILIETPQRQREIIEQEFRNTLKISETNFLYADFQYFISKQMPILFEMQRFYYQICFYFLSVFHQEYKKNKRLYETEKNKLLNIYIEEKTQQNFKKEEFSDGQFYDNKLEKCFANYQVQQTLNKYSGKGINFKSNEQLLKYFIDTNFYYFNKQIHIVDISQQNKPYAKILNLLTEINDENKRKIASFIKKKISESQSIIDIVDDLSELKYQYDEKQLEIIFRIICEMMNFDFEEFWIYRNVLKRNFKKKNIPNLKKISLIKEKMKIQEMIQLIKHFEKEFWEIIQYKFHKCYCIIINTLIQHQMQNQQENEKELIIMLRERFNQNRKLQKYNQKTQLFFHLLSSLQDNEIISLFMENQQQSISLQSYISTVNILFKIFSQLQNDIDQQQVKNNLEQDIKLFKSYHLNFLVELISNQINKDILGKIYKLVYYWAFNQTNQLESEVQSFYKNDPQLYQKIFSKLNYFECEQLTYDNLVYNEKKQLCDIYPRGLQICLEEFNITLVELNPQEQYQLIQNWIQNIKDNNKFKDLLPFYFNIIKRGEPSKTFLHMINQQLKNQQEILNKYGYFNQKSIIQLLYNNSNIELQCFILKEMGQDYPVPLLYKIPYEEKTGDLEKYKFNQNTYFIHQKSFTIINLSIQQDQRRVGKTQLINKIFYQEDKFEILDNNKLNDNSIDIMYDYQFQGTRNLSIADAHKFIPLQILDQILPLFKLWIIQLDTEKEIESTIQVLQQLKSFQLENKTICFLIRDSSFQLEQAQILKLKELNIEYIQVANLTDVNLNKYIIENEIQQVGKFLYVLIERKKNNNLINANEYWNLLSQIHIQDKDQIQLIGQAPKILFQIEYELDKLNEQLDQSKVIDSFYSLIQHPNFYLLYFKFDDILSRFNKDNPQKTYLTMGQIWNMVIQQQQKNGGNQIQINTQQIMEKLVFKGEPYEFLDVQSIEFLDTILTKVNQQEQGKTLFISILGQSGSGNSIILNKIFGCQVQRGSYTKRSYFQLLKIYNKSLFGDIIKQVILLDSKFLQNQNIDHPEIDKKITLFILSISDIIIVNTEGDLKTEFKQYIETNIFNMAKLVNNPKQIAWCFNQNNNYYESNCALFLNQLQSIKENLKKEFFYQNDVEKAQYYDEILDIDLQNIQVLGLMKTEYIWNKNKYLGINQNWRQIIKNDSFFEEAQMFGIYNIQIALKKMQKYSQSRLQVLKNLEKIWEQTQYIIAELSEFKKLSQFQQNDYIKEQYQQIVSQINFPDNDAIKQNLKNSLDQNILSIEILNDIQNEQIENLIQYDHILQEAIEQLKSIQDEKKISKKIIKKYQNQIADMIAIKKQQTSNIMDQQLQNLEELKKIKEHQYDQLMREKFNQLMKIQTFPDKQQFIANIHQFIQQNNQDITTEKLDIIKTEQIKIADQEFNQKQEQLLQKIEILQKENNIKEEIIQQFQEKIQEQKHMQLQSETKSIQENLQKTQEQNFVQFKIKEIQQDPNMIQELKENPIKMEAMFNQVQNKVKQKKEKQDDDFFKNRCNEIFEIIQSQFKGYSLQSTQQENYKLAFLEKLIKDQPNQQDYLVQYNTLSPELQQKQFKVLEKTDKKLFQEIFTQKIINKLESCFNISILQIKKFYLKKIKIQCLKKQNIESYMKNGDILKDFESEIKNNDKQQIQTFLAKLTIFDFEIINEKVDQLCQAIQKGITDQEKQEFLLQCFKPIEKQGNQIILNEDSISKMHNNCKQLTQCLKQFEVIEINDYSEIDTEKYKDYYLIESKPTIEVQKKFKQSNQIKIDIFNYIMNQKKDLETKFNSNITSIIQELMNDDQEHSWNIMYEKIYSLVYDDMLVKNTITAAQDNFGGLIKRLIQKLEIQIKEFNKQFSLFGVLLNEIGEKCIFNYAIFMIWRIVCFKYWEQKKKNDEKELTNLEQDLFIKFKADLLQNRQEQSQIRGKQQATEILKILHQKLYSSYATEVKSEIAQYDKETSFDLIKRLDTEILEKQNNSITNNELLEYIRNHAGFIETYVRQNLNQIKSKIQQKLSKKLKDEMKFYLEQILKNTKKLNDFQQNLVAKDYFVQQINPDEAPNLLYKIVMDCIQGALDKNLINLIKPNMIQGFQIQGYHKFTFILKNPLQNKLDEEIQILYDFMQSFNQKIQDEMKGLDQLDIDFDKLDIQSYLDALQVKQIGCQESCPICKRKCDLELDSNHRHQCRNGHQLRGMNGLLVGCNPSLFTCEEIQDYCKVQFMETKSIKYWGDIKDIYNDWLFSCIDVTEKRVFLKKKFTNIWNLNVGQVICKSLTQEIGKEIQFITQEVFDKEQTQRAPKPIHYVIMLDDSGSMGGKKFDSAKAGVIAFLSEIHKMKNKDSRVTIIMFNSNARVEVDFEVINPKEQEQKIIFQGGGTDFDKPFNIAYEKIIQRPDFDKFYKHSMFFYTDGDADYPKTALNKFESLSPEQKQKIELIACSEEGCLSEALKQLVTFFKEQNFAYAELQDSIKPEEIGSTWIETISQRTHQISKLG